MSVRPRVALVFGGDSSEHSVSCLTAASVMAAIDHSRFEVVGIGITPTGRWTQLTPDDVRDLTIVANVLPQVSEDAPDAVVMRSASGCQVATRHGDHLTDIHDLDVAFALLHGPFGEDGTVQGLFEMLGLRYVGSGVAASAVGMDKHVMKMVLAAHDVPMGPYTVIEPHIWATDPDAALAEARTLEFPVYVKPARGGSSMGISRVADPAGLVDAIEEARRFDPKVIIEQGFTDIREIECAVLGSSGDAEPRTSKLGEIRMHTADAFYDFDAKYLPEEQVSLDVPANVDDALEARVQKIAALTFRAVGCEGLARVDTFVTRDGEVFVNEINTMPGFTKFSMFPMLWQASGLEYPELIAELIRLATERPLGLR
ncbi:MAG TPA: D-alanine--D-alanine ligase family protein [Propionibacteriaceae bacterium]|nr:D-alanine--D-alanine ligase family protein [Propionibacteriaceae bacterium]